MIGIDADAASMAEASRRASRSGARGLPNAVFAVGAAEALPAPVHGLAGAVTIHFPWGSLLRGVLGADRAVLGGIAAACGPGASVTAIVSITARDRLALPDPVGDSRSAVRVAGEAASLGLTLVELRRASRAEVTATNSSWAKRIGAGHLRPATLLRFRREDVD